MFGRRKRIVVRAILLFFSLLVDIIAVAVDPTILIPRNVRAFDHQAFLKPWAAMATTRGYISYRKRGGVVFIHPQAIPAYAMEGPPSSPTYVGVDGLWSAVDATPTAGLMVLVHRFFPLYLVVEKMGASEACSTSERRVYRVASKR